MGLFSSSEFDELNLLVEKATSELIPAAQEDLALNLEITDIIKSKRVSPKDSLRILLNRLTHENPNVQLLTLQLFDKCVRNAGKAFLIEMAGREFVDVTLSLMDDEDEYGQECNQVVQDRLIELFQEWALIFQSDPALSYLYDTYCLLKNEKRVIFPKPSTALDQVDPLSLVSSTAPPDWSDSPSCQRCRDTFTLTNRKHHCRKCGETFCQLCSSNEMVLLDMGISDPVRVCDTCFRAHPSQINGPAKRHSKVFEDSQRQTTTVHEDEEDLQMKKAIELSLQQQQAAPKSLVNEDEEALKKAIEASLKEKNNPSPRLEHFNEVELENISMFHQLIGRLVRTRPTLTPEDSIDLKNLAVEMGKLQKRPIESEIIRKQLDESLKGYKLLFGTFESNSLSNFSDTSMNLNQLKSEVIGQSQSQAKVQVQVHSQIQPQEQLNIVQVQPPVKAESLIRTRLGSLSLENAAAPLPTADFIQRPLSSRTTLTDTVPNYQVPSFQVPQQALVSTPPLSNHSHYLPPQCTSTIRNHTSILPQLMCPDMTIHPHPIHSFIHENPYAKTSPEPVEAKKSKKKKKDKDKKKKDNTKDKKREEDQDVSESEKKKSHKKKRKREKKKKDIEEEEVISEDEKALKEATKNPSKSKKSSSKKKTKSTTKDSSADDGRKSPLNLIDL